MANRKETKEVLKEERLGREQDAARRQRSRALGLRVAGVLAVAILGLGAIFVLNRGGTEPAGQATTEGGAGEIPFDVGDPGPGSPAPPIELASTGGGTFDLSALEGKTVVLYFQEGVGCQPCWDQIRDMEAQADELASLGIDEVVSITTNPLDQLEQKVADERITTPVLSDPDVSVSRAYSANLYGMMGDGMDGHSFIVVGPDGEILHRADYGGPPNFTMYVPMDTLLADLREGLDGDSS